MALQNLDCYSAPERERIARAVSFMERAHATQRRISGAPYSTHLYAVAQLLIDEFHADADTVIAGLLHDTVEDTAVTLPVIEGEFGLVVRFLVDGATNVGEHDGHPKILDWYVRTNKSHEKVLRYAQQDKRLLLIKVADRWHNLLECGAMRPYNQRRLAEDSLGFTVPACLAAGFPNQAMRVERLCSEILQRGAQKH
jgi:(p)ppGpp synthase/HD superfamily hydrolase